MIGMLQIITYLLSFYLVVKGIEILQIALASGRERRKPLIIIGAIVLAACIIAACGFVTMQELQVKSIGSSTSQ